MNHDENLRYKGEVENPDVNFSGGSAGCVDIITVQARFDQDGRVEAVAWYESLFDSHRFGNRICPSHARAYGTRTLFLLFGKKWAKAHFLPNRKEFCERRRREKSCTEMVEKSKIKQALRGYFSR